MQRLGSEQSASKGAVALAFFAPYLEVEAEPELHLARRVGRPLILPNVVGVVSVSVGSASAMWLNTLVNWKLQVGAEPLRAEVDVLADREIHVPARQAAQGVAAAIGVEAENALAELRRESRRDPGYTLIAAGLLVPTPLAPGLL